MAAGGKDSAQVGLPDWKTGRGRPIYGMRLALMRRRPWDFGDMMMMRVNTLRVPQNEVPIDIPPKPAPHEAG
jgi:hypothetical protein